MRQSHNITLILPEGMHIEAFIDRVNLALNLHDMAKTEGYELDNIVGRDVAIELIKYTKEFE